MFFRAIACVDLMIASIARILNVWKPYVGQLCDAEEATGLLLASLIGSTPNMREVVA